MRPAGCGRRDVDDMPRVTAWKILEGQVMTVTLEHRALTYTGALTLQPPGCGPRRPRARLAPAALGMVSALRVRGALCTADICVGGPRQSLCVSAL